MAGLAFTACGGSGGVSDAAVTSTTSGLSVTTVVSTTTEPVATTNPPTTPPPTVALTAQEALDQMASTRGAIDYSRLSEGPCGTFSLLVLRDHIEFYEWSDSAWLDISSSLGPDAEARPLSVTSNDYTLDGARDFLVSYDGASLGGHNYGGIFSAYKCVWGWTDIVSDDGVSQTADGLYYDKASDELLATGFLPDGNHGSIVLNFDRYSNYFYFESAK